MVKGEHVWVRTGTMKVPYDAFLLDRPHECIDGKTLVWIAWNCSGSPEEQVDLADVSQVSSRRRKIEQKAVDKKNVEKKKQNITKLFTARKKPVTLPPKMEKLLIPGVNTTQASDHYWKQTKKQHALGRASTEERKPDHKLPRHHMPMYAFRNGYLKDRDQNQIVTKGQPLCRSSAGETDLLPGRSSPDDVTVGCRLTLFYAADDGRSGTVKSIDHKRGLAVVHFDAESEDDEEEDDVAANEEEQQRLLIVNLYKSQFRVSRNKSDDTCS